jgi:VPS inhibitor protein E
MPLKQTKKLITVYEKKLINGTITDHELTILMDKSSFPKSEGYVHPNKPMTEKNHSQMDAIIDFILLVAPKLTREVLHQLTARMISLTPDQGANAFMRNTTLEKYFLAYELFQFPKSAQLFFEANAFEISEVSPKYQEFKARQRMQHEFSGVNDFLFLQSVILQPIIDLYTTKNEKRNLLDSRPGFFTKLFHCKATSTNVFTEMEEIRNDNAKHAHTSGM